MFRFVPHPFPTAATLSNPQQGGVPPPSLPSLPPPPSSSSSSSSLSAAAASSSSLPQRPRRPVDMILTLCNADSVNMGRISKIEHFFKKTSWPRVRHFLAAAPRQKAKFLKRMLESNMSYFLVNERGDYVQIHPPEFVNDEAMIPHSETGKYCLATEEELFMRHYEERRPRNVGLRQAKSRKEEDDQESFRHRQQHQREQHQREQQYRFQIDRITNMKQEAQILHEESMRLAQALLESSDSNDRVCFDSSDYQRQSDIRRQISAIQLRLDAIQAEYREAKNAINNNDFL